MEKSIMKLSFRLMILIAAISLAGCASQVKEEQKAAKDAEFPESRYLTATGAGTSRSEARRQALSRLAAIFESRVYSKTASTARSIVGDDAPELFEKQVDQTIRILTDVKLTGARIGKEWQEENSGDYYALAVLDRIAAGRRLENVLADTRMEIDGQAKALEDIKGRLPRLSALNRITSLLLKKTVLESRLSVLGHPAGLGEMDKIDLMDFIEERIRLSDSIRFFIEISGEQSDAFDQRMRTRLTEMGYRLTTNKTDAAGRIHGTVQLQPLQLNNPGVHFTRAVAHLSLVDIDTTVTISAFVEKVRKGHVDPKEAARKAIDSTADLSAQRIIQSLGTLGVEPHDEAI